MRRFAALYQALDRSTGTMDKRAALAAYFRDAPAEDAAWALWLLAGGKVGGARARIAGSRELRGWIAQASGTPDWLVEASYEAVGDLARLRSAVPGALGRLTVKNESAQPVHVILDVSGYFR